MVNLLAGEKESDTIGRFGAEAVADGEGTKDLSVDKLPEFKREGEERGWHDDGAQKPCGCRGSKDQGKLGFGRGWGAIGGGSWPRQRC